MEWHYKRWMDRYPITVEFKGGQRVINPLIFVCTSNYRMEDIWGEPALSALRRRTKVIDMFTLDKGERQNAEGSITRSVRHVSQHSSSDLRLVSALATWLEQ